MDNLEAGYLNPENQKESLPEIPGDNWETLILMQRHGKYDTRLPEDHDNVQENEKSYGHLTREGVEEAKEITRKRLEKIFENNPENTDILLVNSPTYWHDNPELGQRAQDTAEVIYDTVREFLQENQIKDSRILNDSGRFKGERTRPDERLGEGLFFQNEEFVKFLEEKYGEVFVREAQFWDDYNADKYAEKRKETGAEGPEEVAQRMEIPVKVASRFAGFYHKKNPDRKLVVWMVTHGDGLEPFVQRKFGATPEDFDATYNAAIGIGINDNGDASVELGGQKRELEFLKRRKGGGE